jgi:hypothetical protein
MSSVEYPRTSATMEEDDTDMNTSDNELEGDIEWELQHLKNFGNAKQLDLLRREVGHIVAHGLIPPEGWYDERFEHINMYSHLGWAEMAKRFHNKDQYLHDTALYIMRLSDELLEERGTKPNFHLTTYYNLIMNVQNIWNYYKQVYGGNESDTDMMDLIEGMSFLFKK